MPKEQTKTETPAAIRSSGLVRQYVVLWDDWFARTLVTTLYLVAGTGCAAYAIHFRIEGDMPNTLLAGFGCICGCFAASGVANAR